MSRTEADGSLTVIADRYQSKPLNSPNDVVVKSDGTVWFTDPTYGIMSDYEGHKAPQEQDGCLVLRATPETGELAVVAEDFVKPNGLAFSPDGTRLASGSLDGTVRVYVLPVDELMALARSRVTRALTEAECQQYSIEPCPKE